MPYTVRYSTRAYIEYEEILREAHQNEQIFQELLRTTENNKRVLRRIVQRTIELRQFLSPQNRLHLLEAVSALNLPGTDEFILESLVDENMDMRIASYRTIGINRDQAHRPA